MFSLSDMTVSQHDKSHLFNVHLTLSSFTASFPNAFNSQSAAQLQQVGANSAAGKVSEGMPFFIRVCLSMVTEHRPLLQQILSGFKVNTYMFCSFQTKFDLFFKTL